MSKVTYTRGGETTGGSGGVDFPLFDRFVSRLRQSRRFVYYCTIIGTIGALTVLLLMPNQYTAKTRILPDAGNEQVDRLASLASALLPEGALSAAAASQGGEAGSDVVQLVKSSRVLDSVLLREYDELEAGRACRLIDLWEAENIEYYRELLLEHTHFTQDPRSNVFTVAVETEDPSLSAQIANNLVAELDRFRGEIDRRRARERCEYLSARVAESESELDEIQLMRKSFLEKNRNYAASTDPELRLAVETFDQEVLFQKQLVFGLKQLRAAADMESRRETPRLTVIEKAEKPLIKSGPPRMKYLVAAMFASALLAIGLLMMQTAYYYYFPTSTRDELAESVSLIRSDVEGVVWRMKSRLKSREKAGV